MEHHHGHEHHQHQQTPAKPAAHAASNPPHGHAGHDHHAMMINDFRRRFYVVLVLTVPIMLLSPMIQHWLGIQLQFPGAGYVLAALSSVVFFYGGWPFLTGHWAEIKAKSPGMMTLIGFAITVSYIYSIAVVFGMAGMDFFWELATLILIMLLGHWIEMRSIAGASKELELLVQLMPDDAHLLRDGKLTDVKTSSLQPGDTIVIKPGEKVAADGTVIDGESYLNEAMLTGEAKPVSKHKGDEVIAGSINGNGALTIAVSHNVQQSYLTQVINLVRQAQDAKSRTQLLANKAALWLTIIALLAGIITFLYWFNQDTSTAFAIERLVTVIVICCPHALGLAVPLVVAKSTSLSAQHGLLIKNRTAFENTRRITTLVFDKTGTLTVGKFQVVDVQSNRESYTANDVLGLAAALEQQSEHPIATGIVQRAKEKAIDIPHARGIEAITGSGIKAEIDGRQVYVVSPKYVAEKLRKQLPASSEAVTQVYVLVDDEIAGTITLADELRPESAEAIRILKEEHIKSILLTGDNTVVAKEVAEKLHMDGFFAEVLPHQKLDKIKELQQSGEYVAMTGDGVNDAPALAQADVGIAVGSGSDIAAETADIILVNSNPKDIAGLIQFGKATYKKMIQNLVWATGYNVIALPLAAGVLYRWGILLSPAAGAVLMSVSTIVVAINASRLNVK